MTRLRSIGRYTVEDKRIGKGNFAVVELGTHTVTKTKVALKVIDKRKITKSYIKKNLTREARMMSQLQHPNIARLYETIASSSLYCLVMEFVPGGDLLQFVRGQTGGKLKEGIARKFVRQLVSALHHMHQLGIVHRDLKMENIMLDHKHETVKIIDFGLSNQCDPDELYKTHCGSPEYAAPELYIAGRDYGPEVDIWSLGVCMFAMVTGKLPFTTPYSENRRQHLLRQIRKGLLEVHDKEMEHLTDDCKDLLRRCIDPVPEDRSPLLDIETHSWITSEGQEQFTPFRGLSQDLTLRAQVIEDMAVRLKVSPDQIQDVVREDRLDNISAIFNILLDQELAEQGLWDGDHTRQPPDPDVTLPASARRSKDERTPSRTADHRPNSAYSDTTEGARTPTIVSMVRPSMKSPEKKKPETVDFELDVVEKVDDSSSDRTGVKPTFPPAWAKKSRQLGNATTVNRVKARASKKSSPNVYLPTSDHSQDYTNVDLVHTSAIHILVPAPSFESQPTSQPEFALGACEQPVEKVHPPKRVSNGGKAKSAGCANRQKTPKPIKNVRVSFLTPAKHEEKESRPPSEVDSISAHTDHNVQDSRELKIVDMATSLTTKQNYHGYHTKETAITEPAQLENCLQVSGKSDAQRCKTKEVRLCIAHREFLRDSRAPTTSRSASSPYGARHTNIAGNKFSLVAKRYPCSDESGESKAGTDNVTSQSPLKRYTHAHRPAFQSKTASRRSVDSTSITSSATVVSSPRPILHPSIASIHGQTESAAILSHLTQLRCTDKADISKKPKNIPPRVKACDSDKQKESDKAKVPAKSAEARVCRSTNVEFMRSGASVRGQRFAMFSGMPQRMHHKRFTRWSPKSSAKSNAQGQSRDTRSSRVNARVLKTDDGPSKFIQKFGARRQSPVSRDSHRECRVPSAFSYTKDKFSVGRSPSPGRLRTPPSKSTSPLRRIVDISEQAMNSLVNKPSREKGKDFELGGDLLKTAQRHFSEKSSTQRRSPAYETYTRYVPIHSIRHEDKGTTLIVPNTSPVPRIDTPKENLFNILETIPPTAFHNPTSPASPASSKDPAGVRERKGVEGIGDERRGGGGGGSGGGGGVGSGRGGGEATATRVKNGTHTQVDDESWGVAYRLERKVSDTVRGASYYKNMGNEQRTRAWVADMAMEYGSTIKPEE
ncbi:uncharacterized protein [Diadema setosum]|uniref:uncharacterized protein isoform X2 n=1 Tax=Diadema setosum TaxID=31175 RepID=UPI003B3B9C78